MRKRKSFKRVLNELWSGTRYFFDTQPDVTIDGSSFVANILDTYRANGQMVNEPNFASAASAFCDKWRLQNPQMKR